MSAVKLVLLVVSPESWVSDKCCLVTLWRASTALAPPVVSLMHLLSNVLLVTSNICPHTFTQIKVLAACAYILQCPYLAMVLACFAFLEFFCWAHYSAGGYYCSSCSQCLQYVQTYVYEAHGCLKCDCSSGVVQLCSAQRSWLK